MNAATPTQTPTTQATPKGTAETAPEAISPPAEGSIEAALLEAASVVDGAAPEAETPAAEEAPAVPDKLALAAETLKKAKKIAKSRREAEARADREKLRADNFSRQLEQEQKETARAREEREAMKDPRTALEVLRKAGLKARDLAQVAIDEGTPEAKMTALEAKHAADLATARAEMRAEFEAALKARDDAAQGAQARAAFFANVKPETHPQLARLDQDLVLTIAQKEFAKARANGHSPTDKQVLDWCENLLAAPQNGSAGTPTPKTNLGTTVAKPVAKPSPTSRTVTADLAGRRYTTPANFDELDPHAQKDALAKMIEDAHRDS